MNLRERGITVGDLVIITIIIITTILVKISKEDKQTSHNLISYQEKIFFTGNLQ